MDIFEKRRQELKTGTPQKGVPSVSPQVNNSDVFAKRRSELTQQKSTVQPNVELPTTVTETKRNTFTSPVIPIPAETKRNRFTPTEIQNINKPVPTPPKKNILQKLGDVNKFVGDAAQSADAAALNSATLGISDKVINKFFPKVAENIETVQTNHPIAKTVGDLAGYAIPYGGVEKGLATVGSKVIPKVVSKVIPSLSKKVIKGSLAGGTVMGTEAAIQGKDKNEIGKIAAEGAALGAGGELVGAAIGKVGKTILSKLKSNKIPVKEATTTAQDTLKPQSNMINQPEVKTAQNVNKYAAEKINSNNATINVPTHTAKINGQPVNILKDEGDGIVRYTIKDPTGREVNVALPKAKFDSMATDIKAVKLAESVPVESTTPKSKFAQTVADSPNTDPKLSQDLKNLDLGYDVATNAKSLEQANKRISEDTEKAVRFVLDTKVGSAEHTTTAIQLINKFQKEGNYERAVDIASDISSKLTKNGQAIQAASIYDRLSPEGILLYAQRRVNKLNDDRWFKGLTKEQKINPELAKQLKELSENMKNLTGDAKIEASQELQQALQALGKSTPFRKLESAQTISQLLNTKTILRNVIGNELFYRLERLNKYVATPIDVARSTLTGADRTITFKTGNQGGYWEGFFKGAKAGWKGVNPGGLTTQFDLTAPAFSGKWNPLTYMEKALGATLKGFDYAAYSRAVNQTIGEMAELKAINQGLGGSVKKAAVQDFIKNADKNILDIADQYGKYVTFQDDNVLSHGLSAVKKGLNLGKEFGLGSLVIKYPKTPGALIMRGLDYSAAGFLKSAYEIAKPLLKGGKIDTRAATMALSRAITGTLGFTGLGYYLADNGVITGRTNKDKDVRELQKQTGAGSYKVNFSALKRWALSGFRTSALKMQQGDMLYSYDWAQPIAMSISFGANINQNIKDNKSLTNNFAATAASSLEGALGTIAEQPVLQGVARQFQGYDLGQNFVNTVKGIPSSFIPTALNQVRQFNDNTGRSTYDPSPVKESLNMAQVKIPGKSGKLPVAYDTSGSPKENYQNGSNNFFNVFLNPGFVSKNSPTPVQKEILRLYETTSDKTQFPQVAAKKFNWKNNNFILSGKEYSDFQKTLGEETTKLYDQYMKTPEYQSLPDAEKVKKLVSLISDAKDLAKFQLIKNKGLSASQEIMKVPESFTNNKVVKKMTFTQQNELADNISKYRKLYLLQKGATKEGADKYAKGRADAEMKRKLFANPSNVVNNTQPTYPKTIPKKVQPNYGKGNIDLNDRPRIKNPDGSISTVFSWTFTNDDGSTILVPGVRKGLDRKMTSQEALAWYRKTGEYLGKFKSESAAKVYADTLHEDQAKQYVK